MKNLLVNNYLARLSFTVILTFSITTGTLWVYQTIARIRFVNALREATMEVYTHYPSEAPILPEYKHLREGDLHPLTKTLIVKDNWSDQLILLPGARSDAFYYDPQTGALTPIT